MIYLAEKLTNIITSKAISHRKSEFVLLIFVAEKELKVIDMSYYKTINGKKMDAAIIEEANLLIRHTSDGSITIKDANLLMRLVQDGNKVTTTEENTIDYLFRNYKWTSPAMEWFRTELKAWQVSRKLVPMSVDELGDKHFYTKDVLLDDKKRIERKHLLESAARETQQDHDEIGLWIRLQDGRTVEVFSNFIAVANEFVELRGGYTVPVQAIEKVEI